jgi:hypothetical protein
MELASMLAGEPFTDEPRSVCPVVAGFLRSYNDGVGDEPRQDLYRFAALAVGTRADSDVLERRNALCLDAVRGWHLRLRRLPWRLLPAPIPDPLRGDEAAGALAGSIAAKLVRRKRPGAREAALDLAERLIACTGAEPAASLDEHRKRLTQRVGERLRGVAMVEDVWRYRRAVASFLATG